MDNSFEKLINRVLDSRYKIENVVGIGGMAYVLKAIDLKQENRPVAIKILNQEFNSDENAVKRFVNESEAVAMVDSPNIVKIYDVAISESLKYIVMEFVDGITLKDYIDKVGALSWKEAVHYVRQILLALSHAHEKGIVHRDIKPQNIMLLRDGTVKVTDFGIAKTPTSESLTMTDKAIGTVNYISPEQASGGKVDEKSDLYSVGVMLYEMLTGTLPFTAESPVAVAMMQVSEEPKSPREINSQIPVGLEQIIIKSMSKDPAARFSSAASMEKALEFFVNNPAVVFSGVAENTGTTEEARFNKKKREKEEKKLNSRRKHRSMFPIVLGITLSFFTVLLCSIVFMWNSVLNEYETEQFVDYIKTTVNHMSLEDREKFISKNKDTLKGVPASEKISEDNWIKFMSKNLEAFEDMDSAEKKQYLKDNNLLSESNGSGNGKLKLLDELEFTDKMVIFIDYLFGVEGNNRESRVITIEDYVGKIYTPELKAELEANGFVIYENRLRKEQDKPFNQILAQDPKAGTEQVDPKAGGNVRITFYVNNYTDKEYAVPDCINYSVNQAKTKIKRALSELYIGVDMIEVKEEYNDSVSKGTVYYMQPEAGSVIDPDNIPDKIVLYVSKGPQPIEKIMPDVVEKTREEAADILEEAGITYTEMQDFSKEVEPGKVIRTNIEANTVFYSDEEVIVYISVGGDPNAVYTMPACKDMPADEAKKTIAEEFEIDESIINVVEEYSETVEAGKVISTNPVAGDLVVAGEEDSVILTVSKGRHPRMPEVIYEKENVARTRLAQAGVPDENIRTVYVYDAQNNVKDGEVVDCNVTYNEPIYQDTQIILYVYSESEEDNSGSTDNGNESDNTNNESDEGGISDESFDDLLDLGGY
ncbi:MAG: PASTA domain-containing protein [Ruminococcaceae bacterium]|nr:PASTA domain-containing protein [Oscillospiraceae bacterium]